MEEWKEYKLGDVCDLVPGFAFKSKDFGIGNNRAIKIKDIQPPYVETKDADYVDVSAYDEKRLSKFLVNKGEFLLAMTGATIGKIGKYINNEPSYVNQRVLKFKDTGTISYNYLYYYLSTDTFQSYINNHIDSQSAQPNISANTIGKYPIVAPDKKTQHKIASILSSLDDKIENNRRINANLEAQAQALFKSWFVDFEPFKDQPFVESELGMIPERWKVGKLGELCTFKRGKNLLTKDAIDEGVPVVAGGLEPSCYHNVSNTKSPVVTVSGSGANAGFMRMYYQEVWASDCSFIDSTCENLLFVYCFLSVNRRLLRHAQTGAVQPHVKPSDIHDFDIVIPPKKIIEEFQTKIQEFIQMRGNIEKENSRLASLRDTLLPRLMSGELKVNEVI